MYETVTFHDARWFDTEDLLNEEWRDIPDYVGVYQISNYGRVKRVPHTKTYNASKQNENFIAHHHYAAMILKPCYDNGGYLQIHLCRHQEHKWTKIHRLVAEIFLPNPDNLPQVNHIDGDKTNPRLDNLEWVTISENMQHAFRTGLNKGSGGIKKAVLQFDLDGNFIREYESVAQAAKSIGRSRSGVANNLKGQTTQCGGYTWKLKENA